MSKLFFLDVGHAFGARPGSSFASGLEEGVYNTNIRDRVTSVLSARDALEKIVSNFPYHVREIDRLLNFPQYTVIVSNEENDILLGKYSERQLSAYEMGVNAYIQMHFNAGGGKYAIVGYPAFGSYTQESERMANIFAEVYKERLDIIGKGNLIDKIQIWDVSTASADPAHRRIANCLNSVQYPSILIEPFFVDNENHAKFFETENGKNFLASVYLSVMDRVSRELLDKTTPDRVDCRWR